MERLVLVHGSVFGGAATWRAQQPLAECFELVVLERPGFPPGLPVERVDFEVDAEWVAAQLEPGDHLAGHSYGGVISLLAASAAPGGPALADGDRAAGDAGRSRRPRGRGVRGGWSVAMGERAEGRPGGAPAHVPRSRRLRLRPALALTARARAGRAPADGRTRPVGGGDPARRLAEPGSRSSSSRAPITLRSTPSATASSRSCPPSTSSSPATATPSSVTRTSTPLWPTSPPARPRQQRRRAAETAHPTRSGRRQVSERTPSYKL